MSCSLIFPKPLQVAVGLVDVARQGLLLKHVVASLFRDVGLRAGGGAGDPRWHADGLVRDRARFPEPARAGPAPDLADRLYERAMS